MMMRSLLLMLTCMVALPALAGDQTRPFYGYAYDLESGKYLYTEIHNPSYENGRLQSSEVRYVAADGSLLGQKAIDYRPDPLVPVFRTELVKQGYVEAVTASGARIEMLKIDARGKPEKRKSIAKEGLMAADAGFHSLLQLKFPELMAGQTLSFRFAVAGQLDSFRFQASKAGETQFDGRRAVKLRVQPDSLLRFVAPELELSYDPVNRELLEFRGISNIHDPATGKAYMVRIAYYSQPPPDAPKNLPPLPR